MSINPNELDVNALQEPGASRILPWGVGTYPLNNGNNMVVLKSGSYTP